MAKRAKSIPSHSRLGRGLSSLIGPSSAAPAATSTELDAFAPAAPWLRPRAGQTHPPLAREIPIDQIAPNPHQPRRRFDEAELAELTASILQQGILQPLLVARAKDAPPERPYVLIAGERRLRGARQAGLSAVPCLVREATEQQMLEWSLIENIQRSDLNPLERARAYRDYMDRFGLTQAQLAERTGEARASVANHLRILDLCDDVQGMLLEGALSFGHARALAALVGQPQRQRDLAGRITGRGLSVRQAEQLVAAARQAGPEAAPPPARRRAKAPYVLDMEAQLTRAVGTRVTILPGRARHSGRVVIDYYSLDDFDRIAAALGVEPGS